MNRVTAGILLAVLASGALSGCASRRTERDHSQATKEPEASKPAPPAEPTGTPDSSKNLGNFAEFPAELKHDGFLYGGFNQQTKTQKYRLTTPTNKSEGEVVTQYLGEVDGKYMFSRERTDGLAVLGSDTVSITKGGVEMIQVTLGTLDKPYIEVPAKLAPGTTWKVDSKMEAPNGTINESSSFKVVGEETVTVPAGTMKALKVVGTGTGSVGDTKFETKSEFWMSKESGLVKFSVTQKPKQGDTQTVTLELVK